MVEEGQKAPFFSLKDSEGRDISLDQYEGKNLILYFYPKDDTPGCTKEAQEFTEFLDDFSKKNASIVGISKDSPESHQKFIEKYNLKVTLLSDPDCSTIKDYGAWGEKKNYGKTYMGLIRTTVLIDKNSIVKAIWKNVRVKGHVQKVLKSLF